MTKKKKDTAKADKTPARQVTPTGVRIATAIKLNPTAPAADIATATGGSQTAVEQLQGILKLDKTLFGKVVKGDMTIRQAVAALEPPAPLKDKVALLVREYGVDLVRKALG